MSIEIRQANQSDIPYLYTICLQTGDSGKDATALYSDPWVLGQYFAAPYLFRDPSLCFVAEKDLTPKGYIIGTDDTIAFNRWFNDEWLPPLRMRYPLAESDNPQKTDSERWIIRTIHSTPETLTNPEMLAKYPAHLHIDLLPDLQGQGCGRQLLETLFSALRKRNCPGLHLGVSARNDGAIKFYEKTGFTVLEEVPGAKMMGILL
jgi:ribosomal protein S18 acetylase RimI-like enzyme